MMKNKLLLITICLGSILVSKSAFAGDGWFGGGGDTSFGGSGDGSGCQYHDKGNYHDNDSRIDCAGISWLKYEYVGGSEQYKFVPNGKNESRNDGGWAIDSKCAQGGVGFFHLGVNITENRDFTGGYASYGNITYDGKDNHWNAVSATALNDGTGGSHDKIYQYTYRLNGSGAKGHRLSLSIKTAGDYYETMYKTEGNYAHLLYNGGQLVYKSASSATSKENIVLHYQAFLNNMYDDESKAPDNAYKSYMGSSSPSNQVCEHKEGGWTCTSMPDDVYAFCAFPIDEDTTLKPKAEITIGTTTASTNYSFDYSNEDYVSVNKADPIIVHEPSVSATGNFSFQIGKVMKTTSFTPTLSVADQSIAAEAIKFEGTTERFDGLSPSVKTKSTSLVANTPKEVCAIASSPSKIGSSSTGGDTRTAKACIWVKYVPVVAAIDSETTLTVTDSSKEPYTKGSGLDKTDSIAYGTVKYGVGALNAEWKFTLSSSARCLENDFNGISCNKTYDTADDFKVKSKRFGVFNDGDFQEKTLSSAAGYKANVGSVTKSYNLLPGEEVNGGNSEGISHRSGVHEDGSDAKNAQDESSAMSFTATAQNVVCHISGKEFGLGDQSNYGRMSITTDDLGKSSIVGDMDDGSFVLNNDAKPLFVKSDNTVRIGYGGCIGEQIGRDKNYSAGDWNATIADNVIFGVTTENGNLNAHYSSTGNAVSDSSLDGRNINASEVLGSTIASHVSKGYQFSSESVGTKYDEVGDINIGKSINNIYTISASKTVSAKINVPYNYVLEPSVTQGADEVVVIGGQTGFTININKQGRKNKQLDDSGNYKTKVKPDTRAKYYSFMLQTDTSVSDLDSKNRLIDGDKVDDLDELLGGLNYKKLGEGEFDAGQINDGKAEEKLDLKAESTDEDYNKLCMVAAVYPADSHNYYDFATKSWDIDSNDQSNALTDGVGSNARTSVSVACKTVGKYPSVSVEGNGVVSGGEVKGATTTYNDRVFGSWSEYGLVADEVSFFGSGASLAYDNPQTEKNQRVNSEHAGMKKDYFDSPQTLGNKNGAIGLQDSTQASVYVSQMKSFVENIKSTFFNEEKTSGGFLTKVNDHTYVNANFSNDDGVIIGVAQAAEINSHKDEDAQVIIYAAKNIIISNDVTELYANLISEGKIDTCAEASQDKAGKNGELVKKCNNALVVTGIAYSEDAIDLDRVFGGGSSDAMNLDDDTLVQRAEIFTFDPRIVKWGYDYKRESQPITTTYIEELSTRY